MAEDALKIRRTAKTRFTRKKNEFFKAKKKGTEILKTKFDELTDAWSTVEGKHDIYLMYLSKEEITANEKCRVSSTLGVQKYRNIGLNNLKI